MAALQLLKEGTPCVSDHGAIFSEHQGVVADILQASSLRPEQAKVYIEQPIELFARYVSTLPATRDSFYSGANGLLQLALDCALLTARKAQVWEFSGFGNIERRRIEAPRWRVACILAALLRDLHRVVTQYEVLGEGGPWHPLREPLADFVAKIANSRIELSWRRQGREGKEDEDLAWNLPLAPRIVGDRILDFLYEGDPQIVSDFFSVLSGAAEQRQASIIQPLVKDARQKIIARARGTHSAEIQREPDPAQVDTAASTPPEAPAHKAVPPRTTDRHEEALTADAAIKVLDYSTQLLVKELQRVLAKPRNGRGQIQLSADGRISIRRDWIQRLGFDVLKIASRLDGNGWLVVDERGPTATAHVNVGETLVLNERISALLIGPLRDRDLVSDAVGPAASGTP